MIGLAEGIAKKLQIKHGMRICLVGAPPEYQEIVKDFPKTVEIATALRGQFDLVHAFFKKLDDVLARADKLKAALKDGGILWISYPKAKGLGTDVNRDILWEKLKPFGLEAVAQVSIDETWSALRFKVVA